MGWQRVRHDLAAEQGKGVNSYFVVFLKTMLLNISGEIEVHCVHVELLQEICWNEWEKSTMIKSLDKAIYTSTKITATFKTHEDEEMWLFRSWPKVLGRKDVSSSWEGLHLPLVWQSIVALSTQILVLFFTTCVSWANSSISLCLRFLIDNGDHKI